MSTKTDAEHEKLDQIIQHLFEAREEIEKFAHELSAKDAKAIEVFQQLKSRFKEHLRELSAIIPAGQEGDAARIALEDLGEALSAAPAQDPVTYFVQKQNILMALSKVERSGLKLDAKMLMLHHEFEKVKLKLEILLLKLVVGKFVVTDAFRNELILASQTLHNLRMRVVDNLTPRKNPLQHIRTASKKLFVQLKKSLKKAASH